ncbi:MAG: hypothetical protein LBI72_14350 [Flavobacteriaceae bacterium]|jgi:hypothetical protein|nr:hypothetical protein [Flavobacteriaceae bacterium]
MKRFLLIIIVCLTSFYTLAQSKVVKDGITNEPIGFVEITQGKDLIYSNIKGEFILPSNSTEDLTFTLLGYNEKRINYKEMTDIVYLEPISSLLKEITINANKVDSKIYFDIKYSNKNRFLMGEACTTEHMHGSFLYPKENDFSAIISKFSIYFDALNKWDEPINHYSYIRVYMYSVLNKNKGELIFMSNPILINKKKRIDVDIEDLRFVLDKEGVLFEIEYIGDFLENDNKKKNNRYIRPVSTNEEHPKIKVESYLRTKDNSSMTFLNSMKDAFGNSGYNLKIDLRFLKL